MERKKILILGMGKSGMAASKLGYKKGYDVFVYDERGQDNFTGEQIKIMKEINGRAVSSLDAVASKEFLVVASPGMPLNEDRFKVLKNMEVISEIQFAWRYLKGKSVAVTGTNGKSTTVALITHLLNIKKIKAISCGNYGLALSEVVLDESKDNYVKVVELSSFQLERTSNINPFVSISLSVTEDHLNRYSSYLDYEKAKIRLFKNNSIKSHWVVDAALCNKYNELKSHNKLTVVTSEGACGEVQLERKNGMFLNNQKVVINNKYLRSECNQVNLIYALCAVSIFADIDIEIDHAIKTFKPLPYRQEEIFSDGTLKVINDSKSSSPDSVIKAIDNHKSSSLILIIGGRNKDASFAGVASYISPFKMKVIAFGESGAFLKAEFLKGGVKVVVVNTLKSAVNEAFSILKDEKVILFSPGCESFDQFENYSERGRYFNELIKIKINKNKQNNIKGGKMKKSVCVLLMAYFLGILLFAGGYKSNSELAWTTKFERYVKHTVQGGDTIAKIAKIYGTTKLKILVKNKLGKGSKLLEGQKLVIPVDGYKEKLII